METVSTTNRFRNIMVGALAATRTRTRTHTTFPNRQPQEEKDQCLFDIYKKEGDHFFVRRKYKKAVDSYSLALSHQPRDMTVMIARSRCYANMGLLQHALTDAEAALDIDSGHIAAIYQKAQVLYSLGQYEMALLFFNKGRKLNPNDPNFMEGLQKAQNAISHLAPGNRMKTTEIGDLSMYIPRRPNFTRRFQPIKTVAPREPEQAPLTPSFRKRRQTCKLVSLELQKKPPVTLDQFPVREGDPRHVTAGFRPPDPSTMRDVLTQLYTDKAYFENILVDMESSGRFHEDVCHLAGDGLTFVVERMLFWAQFGTPAPSPCGGRQGRVPVGGGSLQPFRSARGRIGGQSSLTGPGDDRLTSARDGPKMTTSSTADDEVFVEALGVVNKVSAKSTNPDIIEKETERGRRRLRKRATKSERGRPHVSGKDKAQVSGTSAPRNRKLKKRRKKKKSSKTKEEEEEEWTSLPASEAAKLKFKFDSYRPSTNQPCPQPAPLVPPLVRTKEELSTDDWDSESEDDCADDSDHEDLTTVRPLTDRALDFDTDEEGMEEKEGGDAGNDVSAQENDGKKPEPDPVKLYLIRVIREVAEDFDKEQYLLVEERAHSVLTDLDKYGSEFMADKMELVATLHSFLGNVYVEISDLDLALKHHSKDLQIGEEMKDANVISRALGNMGRTHVIRKDFSRALECFARKSQYVRTPMETAWLYHEIANCFLQLRHYEFARDAAANALGAATEADSNLYQLQASVLLAVAEVKLNKYNQALDHFTFALDQAKLKGDVKAESSIRSALQQVNQKIASELREKQLSSIQDKPHNSADELTRTNSADGDEDEGGDEELAHLKESDDEHDRSGELQVMEAAAALVTGTPVRTKPPSPPNLRSARFRQNTQDILQQGESSSGLPRPPQVPHPPHAGISTEIKQTHSSSDKQSFSSRKSASVGLSMKHAPSILVPPPSQKRLEKERQLREQREAMAAEQQVAQPDTARSEDYALDTFRSGREEELVRLQEAEDPKDPDVSDKEEKRQREELVERIAVRFRSFISEITPPREDSVLSRKKTLSNMKHDNVTDRGHMTEQTSSNPEDAQPEEERETGKENEQLSADEVDQNNQHHSTTDDVPEKEELKHDTPQTGEEGVQADKTDADKEEKDTAFDHSDSHHQHRPEEDEHSKEADGDEEAEKRAEEEETKPAVDPIIRRLAVELNIMEEALNGEDAESVISKAQAVWDSYTQAELDKEQYQTLVAKLHSFHGTAAMMLEDYSQARQHHEKDLEIGQKLADDEIQARALENLGRVHVLQKNYEKALEQYVKRLEMDRDDETSARIFHEIGNCFFQVHHYTHARDSALLAVQHAGRCGNSLIQLQSSVLIAVCHVKDDQYDKATNSFEQSLDFAVQRDDAEAEAAIKEAMRSLKSKERLAAEKFKQLRAKTKDEDQTSLQNDTETDDAIAGNDGINETYPDSDDVTADREKQEDSEEIEDDKFDDDDPLAFLLRWRRRPAAFIFLDPHCIVRKDGQTHIQKEPNFKLEPLKKKAEEAAPLNMEPVVLQETIIQKPATASSMMSGRSTRKKRGSLVTGRRKSKAGVH